MWLTLTDSDTFRRFSDYGMGRRVFRSDAYRHLNTTCNRVRASYRVRRDRTMFSEVRTFCCFIGHNKSGASMLGGLLDAHPRVVLSDEVDALRYIRSGFGRDEIFTVLQRGAESEARKGRITARRLVPYSYAVPGQWQGRTDRPLVVGDTTTGTTTRRLGADPALLDDLRGVLGDVELRFVQVIRNPFDPISVMMVRGNRSFQNAIDHYFAACDVLVALHRRIDGSALHPVRHEDFVRDPTAGLASIFGYLDVEADDRYLASCASIIRPQPDRSREMVPWTRPWIDDVERRMSAYDFLRGYSYDA